MKEENAVFSHIARVRTVGAARIQELLTFIREKDLMDEAVMEEFPPYIWRAEISNNLLDSHYTRMSKRTLENYAADAEGGVAFLSGHNWRELPLGYSLSGAFEAGDKMRVLSEFYTVRGLTQTDDLIARMQTGLVRDVSVGFHGGTYTCDICGRDIWDWDCRHVPGLMYEEKKGDTVEQVLSTFTIDDARLSEVSAVFDGSTPDAMILRATHVAETGGLTPKQVEILENRYRITLPAKKVIAIPKERKMEGLSAEQVVRIKELMSRSGHFVETDWDALDADGVMRGIEKLTTDMRGLQSQAAEGRQYRTDLVAEAIAEGVRAYGNDFDTDTYRSTLESAPLATVKRMRDDWKKSANAGLPAGRSSVDVQEQGAVVSFVPDEAYS